jgi:hypothetical protein
VIVECNNDHNRSPSTMSSRITTPAAVSSSSSSENPGDVSCTPSKKISNTGALLEEYQYDDEETVDLLNAIRNWNLEPRSPQSPDYVHHDHEGGSTLTSLTSTIGTSTDIDTITTATSNSKGLTKLPRTPMCNYSSKPSSLTSRILDPGGRHTSGTPTSQRIPLHLEKTEGDKIFFSKTASLSSGSESESSDGHVDNMNASNRGSRTDTEGVTNNTRRNIKQSDKLEKEDGEPQGQTSSSPLPQYVTMKEKTLSSKQSDENSEAMNILRQTAAVLGLGNTELHSVLPTVQKLVKVITEHVPRLENFVEEVCEVVIDEHEQDADFQTPKQNRSKRRRNRKNMKARKERMETAIKIVKKNSDAKQSNKKSDRVLRDFDTISNVIHLNDEDENGSSFNYEDYQSYGSFTTAVKEKLSSRQQGTHFSLDKTPVSSKNLSKERSSFLTDKESLEEINRLIEFEERYNSRLNGLVNEEEDSESSTSPSQNSNSKSDTVTQDLLSVDTTTLRRFVLHFAYLFSARQDDILGKMNELYVYSHETNLMINSMKKAMGLPPSCPIHSVARKVVAVIESEQRGKK